MTICFFGIYDPAYARTKVLAEGLRAQGHTIVECRADPSIYRGISKYFELYRRYRALALRPDALVVAFPGQTVAWLARLLYGREIILDAFLSLYDSNVFDRKVHHRWGLGVVDWLWDYTSAAMSATVLLDTNRHIDYFVRTFKLPPQKFVRVLIGADESVFYPRSVPLEKNFTVHFHGNFIPLQGIGYILDAATLLKDEPIYFRIVGAGQEYKALRRKAEQLGLNKVVFTGRVPLERVPDYIASAHVTLGIFGDTEKTQRVIPNKVYEQLAMGKPVITAQTPAMRELEEYGEVPVRLVPAANGAALAAAVRELCSHPVAAARMGGEARAFFTGHLSAAIIGRTLWQQLLSLGRTL